MSDQGCYWEPTLDVQEQEQSSPSPFLTCSILNACRQRYDVLKVSRLLCKGASRFVIMIRHEPHVFDPSYWD